MAETYCGKSCDACSKKELMRCPGCKAGPGRAFGGDCDLAKCCSNRGHETCATCTFRENCTTLQRRDQQPEYRKMRIESEQRQKEMLADRAAILGKWLWILFWMVVPAAIVHAAAEVKLLARPYLTVTVLELAVSVAYGAILLKLSAAEHAYHKSRYRIAGICSFVDAGINTLAVIIIFVSPGSPEFSGRSLLTLLVVAAGAAELIGTYHEYSAHSFVLEGVDNKLSEKWETLLKMYIGSVVAAFVAVLLLLISRGLGLVLITGSAIAVFIVSIAKIVYLYQTAKVFREYSAKGSGR